MTTERKVTVKPAARKSLGEFKPLLQFSDGRSRVVEQSPERATVHTRHGIIKGDRYARGTTYKTREEAIAAAQAYMDLCREEAEKRLANFIQHNRPEHALERVRSEIEFWSGR